MQLSKIIVPDKYFNEVYNHIYVQCANRDEFHQFYYQNREVIDVYIKMGFSNGKSAEDVADSVMNDLYF